MQKIQTLNILITESMPLILTQLEIDSLLPCNPKPLRFIHFERGRKSDM